MHIVRVALTAFLLLAPVEAAKAETVEELKEQIERIIRLLEGTGEPAATGRQTLSPGELLSGGQLKIQGIESLSKQSVAPTVGSPRQETPESGTGMRQEGVTAEELRKLLSSIADTKSNAAAAVAPPERDAGSGEDINERLRRIRQDELREEAIRNGGLVVIPFQ